MTQEKWADKIAALLRKAESTTPEEAEALMSKAQELMAKYAIDEAMIRAAQGSKTKHSDPITWDEFVTVGIYRHALYKIDYYCLLVFGCQVIEIPGSPWKTIDGRVFKETRVLRAVGLTSDIHMARMMATSLKLQCMRAESVWWKEHQHLYKGLKHSEQHRARRGFMFAFGAAAFTKLKEANARAKTSAESEHGRDSVALVLRDKSMIISDEFNRVYPQTRKTRSRINQGDTFAQLHGYKAGERADVGVTSISNLDR